MKACVCVDYLSHEWSAPDLIQAHRELQRQKSKTVFRIITHTGTQKEMKKLNIERNRQVRYENALWRQMARSCTKTLSYSNQMIHPSTVNWQKESDVTWLYGPLYMPPESSSDTQPQYTHPSLSFLIPSSNKQHNHLTISTTTLKPVLKKTLPGTSLVLQKDYWIRNDRYWSKCASDSGKQNVRFHPDITEVSYLPETPVKESLCTKPPSSSYFDLDSENEQDDDEEEEMWQVVIMVGSYFKSVLANSVFPTATTSTATNSSRYAVTKKTNNGIVQLCTSAISFTAWFMYQSVVSILSRTMGVSQRSKVKPASAQVLDRKEASKVTFA